MSTTEVTKTETTHTVDADAPDQISHMNMESVNRVAKLPVVEATINAATSLYEKAKVVFFSTNVLFPLFPGRDSRKQTARLQKLIFL